ncbi:MAG TPA: ATP synthase F1 subunit epsilon [Thermoanaerobaculia bacterium]|nr:ATP synthase F1 subunit epsilon [Thermoanaerobaculia bacterium]
MAELPTKINLTVVTRERKIIEVQVDEVVLPATDGEIGVLPGHTPLLTTLKIGQMRYRVGNTISRLVLSWGFAEVLPDRVIVLAETARLASEIDAAAAEAERIAAEREIADLSSHDPEFAVVEARLEESIAMINVHREH